MKLLILFIAVCFGKKLQTKKDSSPEILNYNTTDDSSSAEEEEQTIQRILTQTQVDEELTNDGRAVHHKEALKAFEEKMKNMDPIDITSAETIIEKQEEALAEQKAEVKNKVIEIVEGDIIKTELVEAIMSNDTSKRQLNIGEKWSLEIAYELPVKITGDGRMQRAINEAIRELSKESCLKFLKRLNNGNSKHNLDIDGVTPEPYLRFIQGNGCYSYVGKQSARFFKQYNNGQEISIGNGCEYKGTVMHEILHALGFWHEQSRLDRDQFVKINMENIEKGMEDNFLKYESGQAETFGFEYDLDSIMHYGTHYFSKNGKSTIDVLGKEKPIGQRDGLSKIDKAQLNALYCSKEDIKKDRLTRFRNKVKLDKNIYAS
ncbi:protein SpAN isoform X2 [Hydra vulgaris]|uniref:Metalloendopeptidase n=2 Tax=Hydra vulgaris TaxID=6087 RepID=A0ABM4DH68_HYDVU